MQFWFTWPATKSGQDKDIGEFQICCAFYVNYKPTSSRDDLSIILKDVATDFEPFEFFPSLETFEQLLNAHIMT